MNQPQKNDFYFTEKAHITKDLKGLILKWLTFRLYVVFKTTQQYGKGVHKHFYGNEFRCTYNQILHGHTDTIILNKQMGYDDLVKMIEKGWLKGKYMSAQIYSRSNPDVNNFDVLHREYSKGKLKTTTVFDPGFTESSCILMNADDDGVLQQKEFPLIKKLYTRIERGRVVISETPFPIEM